MEEVNNIVEENVEAKDTADVKVEKVSKTPTISIVSFILAAIFTGIGFYKIFVYSNPEHSWETAQNVYVGGDAYNYIINSNYATAYFVLAGVCVLLGGIFIIKQEISALKSA